MLDVNEIPKRRPMPDLNPMPTIGAVTAGGLWMEMNKNFFQRKLWQAFDRVRPDISRLAASVWEDPDAAMAKLDHELAPRKLAGLVYAINHLSYNPGRLGELKDDGKTNELRMLMVQETHPPLIELMSTLTSFLGSYLQQYDEEASEPKTI